MRLCGCVVKDLHAESSRFLRILLPNGGNLVATSQAYFDESYEDRKPRILCVAGYVFRKSRAIQFGQEWSRYLRSKGLPYFHANECAHGVGVFEGRADTHEVARKLIALTKAKSEFGVAIAVDQDVYAEVFDAPRFMPTPYAFAITNCCYQIAHYRSERAILAKTEFNFEQGHRHAGDAHTYLRFLLRSDEFGSRVGYRSHSFVPKETPHVQPADLLAWLWRLHSARKSVGDQRPERRDLIALRRPQDNFTFFGRAQLESFKANIRAEGDSADEFLREIGRQVGMSEELVEEFVVYRPDYRTTNF